MLVFLLLLSKNLLTVLSLLYVGASMETIMQRQKVEEGKEHPHQHTEGYYREQNGYAFCKNG